ESSVVSLHTRTEPLPNPDNRAYEMVSPPNKNFGDAGLVGDIVARDGQAIQYGMFTGFGDPPGQVGFISTSYFSLRSPDGWHTRLPFEPECIDHSSETQPYAYSPNLDRIVIKHHEIESCPIPSLDAAAPPNQNNVYLGDYSTDPPTFQLLTPQPGGAN